MKAKFFICLISLFLFVAAVDTIPDPPAIPCASGYGGKILYPLIHVHRYTFLEGLIASGSSRRIQSILFVLKQDFSDELVRLCPLALVLHVADSSPPLHR